MHKKPKNIDCKLIYRSLIVFLLTIFLQTYAVQGQVVNDSCKQAVVIPFGVDNFATGVFKTDTYNLVSASIENGEFFHSSQTYSGNDKKSIWFKFHLPTKRGVRIDLNQPSNNIGSKDAGFTAYKTNSCFPGQTEVNNAFITPLNQFGSSFHPCMDAGDYYIQVSTKANVSGVIFLELTLLEPHTQTNVVNATYDKPDSAYDFGVVNNGYKLIDYEVGCLTVEDSSELYTCFGGNYNKYLQSNWFTFTTGNRIDHLELELGPGKTTPISSIFQSGTQIRYQIFKGDVTTTHFKNLPYFDSCGLYHFAAKTDIGHPLSKHYTCALEPNQTYSIQVLYKSDFMEQVRLGIKTVSADSVSSGTRPILSTLTGRNTLGTLSLQDTGSDYIKRGYFSCASKISPNNKCGNVNEDSIIIGINNYGLSQWYTFTLTQESTLWMQFRDPPGTCKSYLRGRLFSDQITNNCADVDTQNLIGIFDWVGNTYFNCLPAGDYSVQILGVDTAGYQKCAEGFHLGRNFEFKIKAFTTKASNLFHGKTTTNLDVINGGNPLPHSGKRFATADTFGCADAPLPLGNSCNTQLPKASYRTFVIGDVDSDNVPDSGVLTVDNLDMLIGNLDYKLYKGDAAWDIGNRGPFTDADSVLGLSPYSNCLKTIQNFNQGNYCITPGTYTFVTFAGPQHFRRVDRPSFTFKKIKSNFSNPKYPENLDTIRAGLTSTSDFFSCLDNPANIDNVTPCSQYKKQLYRTFYVEKPTRLGIYLTNSSEGVLTLFKGKSDDGLNTLKLYRDRSGTWQCFKSRTPSECDLLPAGWYTLVSYSYGATYDDNIQHTGLTGNVGSENTVRFVILPQLPGAQFNRPNKAFSADSLLNSNRPLFFNSAKDTFPHFAKKYRLASERFNCYVDTPWAMHPIVPCDSSYNRIAYYTFGLAKESSVRITGLSSIHRARLYNFDVKKSAAMLTSVPPIQNCTDNAAFLEFCRLQPDTYTLVVFVDDRMIGNTISPEILVDSSGISRFDFAKNAYDFGEIIGDSILRNGKSGTQHPDFIGRPPSHDFIFCNTGAFPSDPAIGCSGQLNMHVYDNATNNAIYKDSNNIQSPIRNVWYTFTLKGSGKCKIKVNNHSPGQSNFNYPMALFMSDVDGQIPFNNLQVNGGIDSTLADGLIPVANNYKANCNLTNTLEFTKYICDTNEYNRYYLLVYNYVKSSATEVNPISQVSVDILYDSVPRPKLRYDYFSNANFIDGAQKLDPPYSNNSLTHNTEHRGAPGYFLNATTSSTDPDNSCDAGNIWYKFNVTSSGNILLNYLLNNSSNYSYSTYLDSSINLYYQSVPNDSTSNGLVKLPISNFTDNSNQLWGKSCVQPGTYYLMFKACNGFVCSDRIVPIVKYVYESGDFCFDPSIIPLNSLGTAQNTTIIDCHTIGEGFGEDGSNMECLYGPQGYKSSWFRIDYTDTVKADLQFELSELTTANTNQIRYRVLLGNCNALTSGPCNSNALTQFSLKCMTAGSYYVQIVSPENSLGSISLKVIATANSDTTCIPTSTFKPVANFNWEVACGTNQTFFNNLSSQGDSIRYYWDFGYNNQTDTAFNPTFLYPTSVKSDTYNVKLVVKNIAKNTVDSIILPVFTPPNPTQFLPRDTGLCLGETLVLRNPIADAAIRWDDNSTDSTFEVTSTGVYYATLTIDTCEFVDSIVVRFYDLPTLDLGSDTTICKNESVSLTGPLGMASYLWNTQETTSSIIADTQQLYILTIEDNRGCINRDSLLLSIVDLPDASLHSSQAVCKNDNSFQINPKVNNGGVFSGGNYISPIGQFDPKIANQGINKVFYTYTDSYGCSNQDSTLVEVYSLPSAAIIPDGPYCLNHIIDTLTPAGLAGGIFYGGQYVNNMGAFNPNIAGVGNHIVFYTVTDGTTKCKNTDSTLLVVNSLPDASLQSHPPICVDSGLIQIQPTLNTGGTFSGDHISATGAFNTLSASAGVHSIYYTFTDVNGCSVTDSSEIRVNALPVVKLDTVMPKCLDADTFQIPVKVSPGGWFTSNNHTTAQGDFIPAKAGAGDHSVIYHFVDNNGCYNADTSHIKVNPLPNPSILPNGPFCSDVDSVFFQTAQQGGSFKQEPGIRSNGLFLPKSIGAGDYTLTYQILDSNGCFSEDSIQAVVHPLPNAEILPQQNICIDSDTFSFTPTQTGGNFYGGNFISSNGTFNPQTAGIGVKKIYYEITDNHSCYNQDSTEIEVYALPDASITSTGPWCIDNPSIVLSGNSLTQKFSGPGITYSPIFEPNLAGAGTHKIIHEVTDANACYAIDSILIKVNPLPVVDLLAPGELCDKAPNLNLQSMYPGGSFTGNNTSNYINPNGQFSASVSGPGTFPVYYQLVDSNSCENKDTLIITVNPLPNANLIPAGPYCIAAGLQQMDAEQNPGGVYFGGNYISTTGSFDPQNAGSGIHPIYYKFTDYKGCTDTGEISITVYDLPDATLLPAGGWCIDAGTQKISAQIGGGTFFGGPYIDNNGNFDPSIAGAGNHAVYYEITDNNNCYNIDSAFYEVFPLPTPQIISNPNEGCEPLTVNLSTSVLYDAYNWAISNGEVFNSANPLLILKKGEYMISLVVTDQNGCTNQTSDTVNVWPLPFADFVYGPELITLKDPKVSFTSLSLGEELRHYWDFGDGMRSEDINPVHAFIDTGDFDVELIVADVHDCKDVVVKPLSIKEQFNYHVPTAFTPGTHPHNDDFKVKGTAIKTVHYQIFNRWGEKIFDETLPYGKGWDGTYRSELVQNGVYMVILTLRSDYEEVAHYHGEVHVLR